MTKMRRRSMRRQGEKATTLHELLETQGFIFKKKTWTSSWVGPMRAWVPSAPYYSYAPGYNNVILCKYL